MRWVCAWSLLIAVGGNASCGAGAAPSGVAEASAEGPSIDLSMEPQVCPLLDAGDGSVDAAFDGGGATDGASKCGADGVAFGVARVVAPQESFEAHAVSSVLSECEDPGIFVQIKDGADGARGVSLVLPLPLRDPNNLAGTYDITGTVTLSDGSVKGSGTLEITAAVDPFHGGHFEGRFSLQAERCTVASGTFSTAFCSIDCIQI